MLYSEIEKRIIKVLEKTPTCVIATANKEGVVSAAQMCLVNDGLKVYLQTDKTFEKVKNIKDNPNVAINLGAYYFKGIAKLSGHPSSNKMFIEKIKEKHLETYNLYTNLPNEVLIEITLTEAKIWGVGNSKNEKTIMLVNLINKTIENIVYDEM